jgi:hypothetical protein
VRLLPLELEAALTTTLAAAAELKCPIAEAARRPLALEVPPKIVARGLLVPLRAARGLLDMVGGVV